MAGQDAVPPLTPDEQFELAMRVVALEGFAHWLIGLDEPGNDERRTVSLNQIIAKARGALDASLDNPDPAPNLARAAQRPRRFTRPDTG